jgi:hypothetical protein
LQHLFALGASKPHRAKDRLGGVNEAIVQHREGTSIALQAGEAQIDVGDVGRGDGIGTLLGGGPQVSGERFGVDMQRRVGLPGKVDE